MSAQMIEEEDFSDIGSDTSSSYLCSVAGSDYSPGMCTICTTRPCAEKQRICEFDLARTKAARTNARKQGPVQYEAFKRVSKAGGKVLVEALDQFDAACQQFGRGVARPPFDWLAYSQKVFVTTQVVQDNALVWYTKTHFAWWYNIKEGWDETTCNNKFDELIQTLSSGRIRRSPDQILMPEKDSVHGQDISCHSEETAYGHKPVKNPAPADYSNRRAWMGHDHLGLNDAHHAKALGLGADALEALGPGSFSRPSVAQHHTVAFKEQLEQQAKEDKVQRKIIRERKFLARPFERSAQTDAVKSALKDKCTNIVAKWNTEIEKIEKVLTLGNGNADIEPLLTASKATLTLRLEMMKKILGSQTNSATDTDQLTDFRKRQDVVESTEQRMEPYEKLSSVVALKTIEDEVLSLSLTSWEHMKLEKERIGGMMAAAASVSVHVSKQSTRVTNLHDRKVRDITKAQAQAQTEMAKDASRVLGDQRRAAATAAVMNAASAPFNGGIKTCSALDHIPADVPEVTVHSGTTLEITQTKNAELAEKPMLINVTLTLDEDVKQYMDNIVKRFVGSHLYKVGRGSDTITADVSNKLPRCALVVEDAKIRHGLTGADNSYIESPCIWCYSECATACGPEWGTLNSVKLQVSGTREVLLVEFGGLLKFMNATIPQGGSLSLGKIQDALRDGSTDFLASLSKHTKMYKATVQANQVLWIPWGFICVERTSNNQLVYGIRWTRLSDFPTASYSDLASVMLPDNSSVKPSSTTALMAKVVHSIQQMPNAPQFNFQPVKQEAVNRIVQVAGTKRVGAELAAASSKSSKAGA